MKSDESKQNTYIIYDNNGIVLNVGPVPHRKAVSLYTEKNGKLITLAYFVSDHAAQEFVELIEGVLSDEIAKAIDKIDQQQSQQIKNERTENQRLRDKLREQAELCERVEGLERENLWLKCDAHGLKGALDLAKKMLLGDE